MTLEDLIYNRLISNEILKNKLAKFDNMPAIFYQSAPGDQADGWRNEKQYPRIDFIVDMQANPERQSSGLMTLNIWCNEIGILPEEIEPEIRNALCDVFMQPDGQPPYCLVWARSDSFETNSSNVIGITALFDVLAFSIQETTDPDPIMAINHFIKDWESGVVIIGVDALPNYFISDVKRPAFYFRLTNLELDRETNTIAWMNASIAGHIFVPTAEARLKWLKYFVDTLVNQGEITMLDTSPMFIRNIKADSTADYLTTGQLRISVQFGILRKPKYAHILTQPNMQE